MLDQSFSSENFKVIFDSLNRKGIYLEQEGKYFNSDIFLKSRDITKEIKKLNDKFKADKQVAKQGKKNLDKYNELKHKYKEDKERLTNEREQSRVDILSKISSKANSEQYKIKIEKGKNLFDDQLYNISKNPEDFFVLKQIQYNINKTFGAKQSDRRSIISQLKLLLEDNFPKIIIRTDIKKFYESIPHDMLLAKIEENSLLSHLSKVTIKNILNQYWRFLIEENSEKKTEKPRGIPRGIGVSAYLSEIYMKDIDNRIKSLPNVFFYARYVDDIIVMFAPNNNIDHDQNDLGTLNK